MKKAEIFSLVFGLDDWLPEFTVKCIFWTLTVNPVKDFPISEAFPKKFFICALILHFNFFYVPSWVFLCIHYVHFNYR